MGMIKKEEIRGRQEAEGKIVCADCMEDDDWKDVREADLFTDDHVEKSDDLFFCDLCGNQL